MLLQGLFAAEFPAWLGPTNQMAKIRVKSPNRVTKAKPGIVRENVRALPCLLVVVLGMALVFYVFYLGLRGT